LLHRQLLRHLRLLWLPNLRLLRRRLQRQRQPRLRRNLLHQLRRNLLRPSLRRHHRLLHLRLRLQAQRLLLLQLPQRRNLRRVHHLRALRRRPRFDLLFRLRGPLLRLLRQPQLRVPLQVRLRLSGRRQELLRHALGKVPVKESDQAGADSLRQCVLLPRRRARLARLRGLRRVRRCPPAGIADHFRALGQTVSGRADRVQVSRCVRCRGAKVGARILRGRVDQAGRAVDLQASQDHLSSGAAGCPRARVRVPACRGVLGCCRRYRRIKRLRRRSRASRSIRGGQRSGSGRRWTNERLRASASYTRRGSVQEQGEQQLR